MQRHLKSRKLSAITVAALALFAVGTWVLGNQFGSIIRQKTAEQYQWDTQQISTRVQDTANNYSTLLYGGRAFILNTNAITPSDWTGFYRSQDIFNKYKGLSVVSYVELVSQANKSQFLATMRDNYGSSYNVTPEGKRDIYALSSLSVSASAENPIGFDLYSTPDRRAVYDKAAATGLPVASGELVLSTGQEGMFIALPVTRNGTTEGFVVVKVYSQDFFPSVIGSTKLNNFAVKVIDVTDKSKPKDLYTTLNWQDKGRLLMRSDTISFGGRIWRVDYQAPPHYNQSAIATALPYFIMIMGFLFICVMALCFHIFTADHSLESAHHDDYDDHDDHDHHHPEEHQETHKKVVTTTVTTTEE